MTVNPDDLTKPGVLKPGQETGAPGALFPRIEAPVPGAEDAKPAAPAAKPAAKAPAPGTVGNPEGVITYDDFAKVQLRTATIMGAEAIDGAVKLLKLNVLMGSERRQIVAGIALYYKPEDLVGKTVVVVSNLAPIKLRGVESQGMLLAASDDANVVLLQPEREVTPGARVS